MILLFALLGQHDDGSNEQIYKALAPELVRYATGLVGRDSAPDVVADAFVKAMTSRTWPEVDNKRAYLYRVVLTTAADWSSGEGRRRDRERSAPQAVQVPPPDLHPEVLEAVMALSVQQRAALILTYWDDLHVDEVADRMGVSPGSVKQHLARGRAALREVLSV